MYKIGEFIVYGNEGVCEVENISALDIPGVKNDKNYYTLKPMHDNGKVFAPVDTKVFMRPVSTYDEVQAIIGQIDSIEQADLDDKNARMLENHYKELMKTHECIDLLTVIVNINEKKTKLIENGKKLGQIEEKFMRSAKSLLEDEFSLVLGIPKEEVESYIMGKVNK